MWLGKEVKSVLSSLLSQAPLPASFSASDLGRLPPARSTTIPKSDSVKAIWRWLEEEKPTLPIKLRLGGVFFGCHLLYPGWWTRGENEPGLRSGEWVAQRETQVTNIRHWLNSGFHEWGPSWDLWDPTGKEQLLFGQIGDPDGDEVDSLHVIVAPKTAIHLKEQMALDLAIGVTVRGTLYNDSHTESTISDNAKAALGKARSREELKRMSYYLVVHDVEPDGRRTVDYIDKTKDQPQIYSAYMWQCLIRKSDAAKGRPGEIDLPRTIFTWEHTNLLNRDCIAFNFRSLEWKKSYLERLGQPLDVLQHSYSVERVLGISLTQPLLDQRRLAGILRTPHDSV